MSVRLLLWGKDACFSRPEMKVERVSYDVMTPSAARGILEAIFWHPGMKYHIDRIQVCSPIRFGSIRRNEVKCGVSPKAKQLMLRGSGELYQNAKEDIVQRSSIILQDVCYVVEAHFTMTDKAAPNDSPEKFYAMLNRRIEKGQCFRQPCFGMREFPAHFSAIDELPQCPEELRGTRDLGYMLYDMDYSNPKDIRPLFFRAIMHDGVLDIPDRNSGEVIG